MQHATNLIALLDAILNLASVVISIRDRTRKHPQTNQSEEKGEHADNPVMQHKPSNNKAIND
jgi:hypothetical protein